MELENFKVWHWMIISLLVGLGMGYWQAQVGLDIDRGVTKTIYQEEFEHRLFETYQPNLDKPDPATARPVISDIVIHPPREDGVVWITGSIVDMPSMREIMLLTQKKQPIVIKPLRFRYPTDVPYKPKYYANLMDKKATTESASAGQKLTAAAATFQAPDGSVMTYLQRLQGTEKKFQSDFHFAWWETRPATLALWTTGSFILIGCLWPLLVRVIVGAGFGPVRKAKTDYDLDRFKEVKSKPVVVKQGPTQDDEKKLSDLTAAMEEKLAKFVDNEDEETRAENAAVEAKIRALPTAPLEPLAAGISKQAEEPKEYTGEFYPVVKTGTHAEHAAHEKNAPHGDHHSK